MATPQLDTAAALDAPASGVDWLNAEQFPHWEEAMRIGNVYQFIEWLSSADPVLGTMVMQHMAEFKTVFMKLQREIMKADLPPLNAPPSVAAAAAPRARADGWIRIEDPRTAATLYYNLKSGAVEAGASAVAPHAPGARRSSKAEAEARASGLLTESTRLRRGA